jgi:hypothetical protein
MEDEACVCDAEQDVESIDRLNFEEVIQGPARIVHRKC